VSDPFEITLGTNATNNDTDADGLLDGTEDANADGIRELNETSAIFQDTDADGLRAAERTTRAGGSPASAKALLAV
jgi:hypothetical protein